MFISTIINYNFPTFQQPKKKLSFFPTKSFETNITLCFFLEFSARRILARFVITVFTMA